MSQKFALLFLCLIIFTGFSYSQNLYNMNSGESITVDENGHILHSGNSTITKTSSPITSSTIIKEESNYYENGKMKIPGYFPSEDPKEDEERYRTAKVELLEHNPDLFNKIFNITPSNIRVMVSVEEFQKMPDIKKQQILANPAKYYIEDVNTNHDCNH